MLKSFVHCVSHSHLVGRWSRIRRAEDAIRAATLMILDRMVAVVALANWPPANVPTARERLNAITAAVSHAALVLKLPDGIEASGPPFKSA